jgi:hypothetical protein
MGDRLNQGFEVEPTPLGSRGAGSARRRRRLPIVIVLLVGLAIPAIAWVGPRLQARPELNLSFLVPGPTPSPLLTPRPTPRPDPRATPLPSLTIADGPTPTGPIAIDVGGLRLVDTVTGKLGASTGLRGDSDAIFTNADGDGWWCVCFTRSTGPDPADAVTVSVRTIDGDGHETSRKTVGDYRSAATVRDDDFFTRFDLELSPDGRTGYLASAVRNGMVWTLALDALDLENGAIVGHSELVKFDLNASVEPSPSPTTTHQYLAGPGIRLSPDGRHLLVWAWIEVWSDMTGESTSDAQVWLVDLAPDPADDPIANATLVGGDMKAQIRMCGWLTWLTDDSLASVCFLPSDPSGSRQKASATLFSLDGTATGHVDAVFGENSWSAEPLIDRANGLLYIWEPIGHVLHRFDLRRLREDRVTIDPLAPAFGEPAVVQAPALPPDWAAPTSDLRIYYGPQLVAEPGGDRLLALGMSPQDDAGRESYGFGSTGIWVFDLASFGLVDQWPAIAAYSSIAITPDGRWLTAVGQPQMDDRGRPASWDWSLTIHDLEDGRAAVLLGRLGGTETQVLQVPH